MYGYSPYMTGVNGLLHMGNKQTEVPNRMD